MTENQVRVEAIIHTLHTASFDLVRNGGIANVLKRDETLLELDQFLDQHSTAIDSIRVMCLHNLNVAILSYIEMTIDYETNREEWGACNAKYWTAKTDVIELVKA